MGNKKLSSGEKHKELNLSEINNSINLKEDNEAETYSNQTSKQSSNKSKDRKSLNVIPKRVADRIIYAVFPEELYPISSRNPGYRLFWSISKKKKLIIII